MNYKQIKVDRKTKQPDKYYRVNGIGEKIWYNEVYHLVFVLLR